VRTSSAGFDSWALRDRSSCSRSARRPRPSWRCTAHSTLNSARAGIDPTIRFADLLPLGSGQALNSACCFCKAARVDLETAEPLGDGPCLIARGDDLGKRGLGLGPIRQEGQQLVMASMAAAASGGKTSSWAFFHRRCVCDCGSRQLESTEDLKARDRSGRSASGSTRVRDGPPALASKSSSAALAEPRSRSHHRRRLSPPVDGTAAHADLLVAEYHHKSCRAMFARRARGAQRLRIYKNTRFLTKYIIAYCSN
jgi:hypothetical protein